MDKRLILVLPDRPATPHPGDLMWIERIEAIRAEEAPLTCPTCGSRTAIAQRRCHACSETKPLSAFPRNRTMHLGREYYCLPCKAAQNRARRARLKRAAFRQIMERSA